MIPLALVAGGALALAVAVGILRSYGPRYRVARLLAALPVTPIAEALEIAAGDRPGYIRVDGRLDSETSFEDAANRPLVFRRTRIEARRGLRWIRLEDGREQVPFEVGDGLVAIGVDGDALGDGLVVIRRESVGTAGELGDRAPAGLDPATPVRAIVEPVSAVEHASVLGVPVRGPDGLVRMTAGMRRPLIVTTLEIPEAMRVIAGGGRFRPALAAGCGTVGLASIALGIAFAVLAIVGGSGG